MRWFSTRSSNLDVPADKNVNVASAEVLPTVTSANGRKVYHWTSQNLSRPDPDAPPKSVKKWKPAVQATTFTDWAQVGAWYKSLEKDQLAVTPAIKAKADALTKGLTTDDDKIRGLFNAVALHTHYIGLEFGIGRYQPHSADDVLSNEYGDCKDKHTLLATLLKAEGIEAWPVLINSSHELDPAMPSPAQFDHVITVVPRQGKLLWMDSTAEVAPVGVLVATLRDKQALAIPAGKPAYLERTPADLPFTQVARFEATGKLDEHGEFTGRLSQTYHGDAELVMRSMFRVVPESQWKEFLQRFSANTGFGGEVSAPEVSAVEKTDEPLHFAYDYKREKYSEWEDRRISPPMPPVGWELVPGIKQTKPADDIDIGSPGDQLYTASVALPAGWHVDPPSGIDLVERLGGVSLEIQLRQRRFHCRTPRGHQEGEGPSGRLGQVPALPRGGLRRYIAHVDDQRIRSRAAAQIDAFFRHGDDVVERGDAEDAGAARASPRCVRAALRRLRRERRRPRDRDGEVPQDGYRFRSALAR